MTSTSQPRPHALVAAAAAVAALAGAAPPVHAADRLHLHGAVARESIVTTRCPVNGGMAFSTETVTTTYSYAFDGRSGRRGEVTTKGHHEYEFDRKVDGTSDVLEDEHAGPVVRELSESAATFSSAVRTGREGRGRKARRVAHLDFRTIAGGLSLKRTVTLPGRGRRAQIPIDERLPLKALDASGGCTATERVRITGAVTLERG